MKTYKDLTKEEKSLVNTITSEAMYLVRENAVGREFVRINMYKDAVLELKKNNETELEICGVHFFSNSKWDDIEKDNQVEIFNFEQDMMKRVEGDGEWTDCDAVQEWLQKADLYITQNVINYLFNSEYENEY